MTDVRNWVTDVNVTRENWWRHLLRWRKAFLHATSGGLLLTVAFFLCRFLAFYCIKCDLASFSRYKAFLPHIMPPKHVEQDQTDAKWLGKKSVFWRKSQRVCRSFTIVSKSIKETENLIFSVKDRILFHSWTPKLAFSLVATATRENTAFGVHSVKYRIHSISCGLKSVR